MFATKLETSSTRDSRGRLRVLVVSHMHANVSRGGGEIAAYQMYEELRRRPEIDAFFMAAGGGKLRAPLGAPIFQPFDRREYVAVSEGYDYFNHSNPDTNFFAKFRDLLESLKPHVVHFHHYANFGVEAFQFVRKICPGARIILTLHEYLAICNHFGQMVTRPGFRLCEGASPRDCAKCFPEISEEDFFIRQRYLRRCFGEVDAFIAPSQFLADRYVAWGLPQDRMVTIENGLPESVFANEPMPAVDRELVFGFFGQLSSLKGINVVLDAADEIAAVAPDLPVAVRIEVHGDASNQPKELHAALLDGKGAASKIVRMHGPYRHSEVVRLMSSCHAVIVPSIWWENSPLVIQEALAVRRPVICSALGGMAEKVRDGVDGFHFRARSPSALAELLIGLAREPERLRSVHGTLARPPSIRATVEQVIDLYGPVAVERKRKA